jgi:hypothetical protein
MPGLAVGPTFSGPCSGFWAGLRAELPMARSNPWAHDDWAGPSTSITTGFSIVFLLFWPFFRFIPLPVSYCFRGFLGSSRLVRSSIFKIYSKFELF